MHRLATIHNVTDDDGRNTVPIARPLVWSAKNHKWRLNPVWHRMLYSCIHMAAVGVKGLRKELVSGDQVGFSWRGLVTGKNENVGRYGDVKECRRFVKPLRHFLADDCRLVTDVDVRRLRSADTRTLVIGRTQFFWRLNIRCGSTSALEQFAVWYNTTWLVLWSV